MSWVFFFHRERRVDEYEKKKKKRDSHLLSISGQTQYRCFRLTVLCSCKFFPKPCLLVMVQLQNTNNCLVTWSCLTQLETSLEGLEEDYRLGFQEQHCEHQGRCSCCTDRKNGIRGPLHPAQLPLNTPTPHSQSWTLELCFRKAQCLHNHT